MTEIRKDEMAQALPMYSDETRYVDSLVRFDAKRSFGFYRVQEKDTLPHFSYADPFENYAAIVDYYRLSGIGGPVELKLPVLPGDNLVLESDKGVLFLTIDQNDTKGHFTPEFGISVLPGHKIVAAAADVASLNPDEILDVSVRTRTGNIEVASVAGLTFESRNPQDPKGMTLDRLIEAAAQTLGLAFLHGRDVREVLPLLRGVKGPVEYYKEVIPGQLLEMEAVLLDAEEIKQFSGDVTFRVDDEVVARVSGIDCILFPGRGLNRVIRMARRKLA